jgi:DNA repair protein RecN (Recombination protein N)
MIRSLHIEHYALIERLDIGFELGFSVITGETGAGKSIILGALGLLRGQRADTRAIQVGAQRCVVEAEFDVTNDELDEFFQQNDLDFDGRQCLVRRELTAAGKSRAFVNDTPVSLTLLRQLGDRLVDVHSQHQNLLIGRQDFQLSVLDILGRNADRLADFRQQYRQLRDKERELAEAREAQQRSRDDEDYLRFQYQQLDEAQLVDGEQDELEQESELLAHAEEIQQALATAQMAVDSSALDTDQSDVLQRLRQATSALQGVAQQYPDAAQLAERLQSCYIELKDIADELDTRAADVEANPQRLSQIEERLNTLYTLEKKHHVESVGELIALRDDLDRRLQLIDGGDERVEQLQRECEQLKQAALRAAQQISDCRKTAAADVEARMQQSLQPLGMPNVRFCVQMDSDAEQLSADGIDRVAFLFSANKNGTPRDVADIASGGEIARVMLCLKALIASAVQLPTIIFDEIDTGVSGSIAERMAHIMLQMGEGGRQVISITHLPQIAALGRQHYHVYKTEGAASTTTHISLLSYDERINELAHMLSGETLTPAAIENAKALLSQNQ